MSETLQSMAGMTMCDRVWEYLKPYRFVFDIEVRFFPIELATIVQFARRHPTDSTQDFHASIAIDSDNPEILQMVVMKLVWAHIRNEVGEEHVHRYVCECGEENPEWG